MFDFLELLFGNDEPSTQDQTILNHMKNNKNITSWVAIQEYRITRLAAIIFLLKEKGHKIDSVTGKRNGKKYSIYYLRSN